MVFGNIEACDCSPECCNSNDTSYHFHAEGNCFHLDGMIHPLFFELPTTYLFPLGLFLVVSLLLGTLYPAHRAQNKEFAIVLKNL